MDDQQLASALSRGEPRATAEFVTTYGPMLHDVARRLGVRRDVDDVVQRLVVAIVVGTGDAPPKIASYRGQGSLSAWVRAVSTRFMIDQRRRVSAAPQLASVDSAALARSAGLVDAVNHARHGEAARAAVEVGFARLTPRARNLLRQASYHGLGVDELGALYRVHRATAARWLQRARQDLHAYATEDLVSRTGIDAAEAHAILAAMQTGGAFSLPSMLSPASEAESPVTARGEPAVTPSPGSTARRASGHRAT